MLYYHVFATPLLFFFFFSFFFNDTATTEIYTLSLHDALPISRLYLGLLRTITDDYGTEFAAQSDSLTYRTIGIYVFLRTDRKSTRLNSSHMSISYAVFCLKKKKKKNNTIKTKQ